MEVKNSNQAKIEKETKNFGTFVILNQKSIIEYIEQIQEKFESDKGYKEKILAQLLPERKYKNTKRSQEYRLISKILKDEIGLQGVGEVTIWRLLKIKEASPETYEMIKDNKISIKAAYNKLFNKEAKEQKEEPRSEQPSLTTRGSLDFDKLEAEFEYISSELDEIEKDERKQPSLKKLKEIDAQLFKLRKKIGALIIDNDPDKFI